MNRHRALLVVLLAVPALSSHAFGMPETAITRTHLLKDIEQSSITAGLGIELEFQENPAYAGDNLFGYVGYAPLDWLELGVGAHVVGLSIYPAVEAKIDVVDVFSDSGRFSLLVMGGTGGLPDDLWFAHAGLGAVLRLTGYLQVYVGAGSDSISQALSLQAGAWVTPLQSLGVSANLKLVAGPEGMQLMVSLAPMISLRPGRPAGAESAQPTLLRQHPDTSGLHPPEDS